MMSFPHATWRYLVTPAAYGAWNMAVDEAILLVAGDGKALPTLRLYAWEPACLSLGYAQPIADVDLSQLQGHGWQLVRRPTGGRAILHIDELTYSVIGPQDEPRLAGGVLESYQVLAQALVRACHHLGVPAQTNALAPGRESSAPKGPVCFEVPSNFEITVEGKKLIGSAQARRREGVLQHGSLPIHGDVARITRALYFEDESGQRQAAARLLERATTLERVLGRVLDWQSVAQAFVGAFGEVLNLDLQPSDLSGDELRLAEELIRSKYAHLQWTGKQ